MALALLCPAAAQPAGPHYAAAEAAFRRGDAREAELEAKLALQQNPLDAKSHFLLACLLEERGVIVAILCDSGSKYLSERFWSDDEHQTG